MEKLALSPSIRRARAILSVRKHIAEEYLKFIGTMDDFSVKPVGKIALFNCMDKDHELYGRTFAEEVKDEQQKKLA